MIEPLPSDPFTRLNVLLGLPNVTFTEINQGVRGIPVPLGILDAATLQKELTNLRLLRRDSGLAVADREIINEFTAGFEVQTLSFRENIARFLIGSSSTEAVSANSAQQVTAERLVIPTGARASSAFVNLANADVDDTPANLVLTPAPVLDELVGVGDGTGGTGTGDFALAFKPFILTDLRRLQEINPTTGQIVRNYSFNTTAPTAANEAQISLGATATSGQITLFQAVGSGNELRADYVPTHQLEEDLNAGSPDMILDPLFGRIRFPNLNGATDPLRAGQAVLLTYRYDRRAGTRLRPFTQLQFEGEARIVQQGGIGVNFIWDIPSTTIAVTNDDVTFGTDDFTRGTLRLSINDAGGTDRFGTVLWADENQARSVAA